LIDFGTATNIDTNGVKGLVGTAAYCAPEVAVKNNVYNEKCDMWSIGIMMFYMLTRRYPFEGDNDNETLRIIKSTQEYPKKGNNIFDIQFRPPNILGI
jgi:serine/threonine protein kinase